MKSEAAEYSSVAQDIKALDQNNYAIVFRGKTSRTARLNDSAQSQFRIEISETKLISYIGRTGYICITRSLPICICYTKKPWQIELAYDKTNHQIRFPDNT